VTGRTGVRGYESIAQGKADLYIRKTAPARGRRNQGSMRKITWRGGGIWTEAKGGGGVQGWENGGPIFIEIKSN